MRFAQLVERIGGDGADAWVTHYEAASALERGEDVILLSIGDPPLDTPAPVIERAIERLRAGDTHYPPASGRPALRAALAQLHQARSGQPTSAQNVVFFAGAQNALFAASLCLAGAGDEVITFDPMYPTYPATLTVSGAQLVRVPTDARFRPDLNALRAAVTARTRAIFYTSPGNPSGVVFNAAELATLGELAEAHDLWLVSDEVYAGLAPGGHVPSLAAQLPGRVVTLGSLSKSHAMSGWRTGWLVGPPELAHHAEQLAMCMLFGLPPFIQEAVVTALAIAPEAEQRIRDFCEARRRYLLERLGDIRGLRVVEPGAGMFLLVDVSATGLTGAQFARELYAAERVSVLDGGAFGHCTAACVRVCFATDEAQLDEACLRLRRFCRGR